MSVHRSRRLGVGVGLAAAAAAAMLGAGVAHAEGGVDEINGWTVTPTSDTAELLTNNATLSDPGDSLGLGTSPIAGEWISAPTLVSSIGSNDQFLTPDALGSASDLLIQDNWLPGIEMTSVQVGTNSALMGFLVPADGGQRVVDLINVGFGSAPLVNPDATGPIDVGGVQLASPQDGALLNDLVGALFTGETADFSKAATLFSDLLGTDASDASAAMADPNAILGSAASAASDLVPSNLDNIAISFDGILSIGTGTATASSSPGLFNLAVADGPHTFANASGVVFDVAGVKGTDSSANATGLLFSAAGVEGTGSTANSTDLLFGAAVVQGTDSTANAAGLFDAAASVVGNDDFAAAAGPLFTGAEVKADDATAIAGAGVADKAAVLADGLTAIARGFFVTDIVSSPSSSAADIPAADAVTSAQQITDPNVLGDFVNSVPLLDIANLINLF